MMFAEKPNAEAISDIDSCVSSLTEDWGHYESSDEAEDTCLQVIIHSLILWLATDVNLDMFAAPVAAHLQQAVAKLVQLTRIGNDNATTPSDQEMVSSSEQEIVNSPQTSPPPFRKAKVSRFVEHFEDASDIDADEMDMDVQNHPTPLKPSEDGHEDAAAAANDVEMD
ncbi:uncharacterized protein CTRU02_200274 [Colletotrichum truncatum]|uniref:Uncharacterized protein n=1 Tax=Colletotrichum truncatum TaxID=5467 RepID=A0ACC3ZE10_COLTU